LNRRSFVSTLAGLPAVAAALQEHDPATASHASRAAAFEAVSKTSRQLLDRRDDGRTAGLCIAVAVDQTIAYSESFGYADLEWRLPVARTTRFRIGSVAKLLTSIGLGVLVERGEIDLDASIERYAPYPVRGKVVTIRQLAAHTAGIPQYGDGLPPDANVPPGADPAFYARDAAVHRYPSLTAAIGKYRDRPLLFEPGTRYHYSSFGWNLIGAAIEQVTGRLFVDFMRENVLEPVGMAHTVEDDSQRIIPERTGFYSAQPDGSFVNAPHVDNSDVYPGGGYLSTAEDLVRLGLALRRGKPITPTTWAVLREPIELRDPQNPDRRSGLGWRTKKVADREVAGHSGRHLGCQAMFGMTEGPLPLTYAILANCTTPKSQQNVDAVIENEIVARMVRG
jgi:serine beta-lactamase-like protein LACTB